MRIRGVVGRLVLIDVLIAAGALVLWYLCFARYNRRRAAAALRSVEAACFGKGKIVETHWFGASRLQAQFRFAPHWFDNARVTLQLRPRALPVHWLLSLWRKQRETLTFESDLDCAPGFDLDVSRHRWLSHKQASALKAKDWTVTRPGPVVLTTRTRWTQELTPVVNTLMNARGHNQMTVRFRHASPHLAATIPLEAITDEQAAAGFLGVLHELAVGASTHRQ